MYLYLKVFAFDLIPVFICSQIEKGPRKKGKSTKKNRENPNVIRIFAASLINAIFFGICQKKF